MKDNETSQPSVVRPGWVVNAAAWWPEAFRNPDSAARFQPLGVDEQGRLHVRCYSEAYRTLLRLTETSVVSRINELVRHTQITGLVARQCPRISILVVAEGGFADSQLIDDVLLETCYDVTQAVGIEHEVFLQLTGETAFNELASRWAAAHTAATADIHPPVTAGVYEDDDSPWNQKLIDGGPAFCLAFCSSEAALPSLERLACAAGIPVRRVR